MKTPRLILTTVLLLPLFVFAEPWLANRYAQNCAACHAPGRVNVPAADRRCTLSCQGCHVNPNGGGLRNLYGKWNENRWLYSFQSKSWKKNEPAPAVYEQQPYSQAKLKEYLAKLDKGDKKEAVKEVIDIGLPMKVAPGFVNEADFDRHTGAMEKTLEPNRNKFLAQIPEGDPIREKDLQLVKGGGDMRYFYISKTDKTNTTTKKSMLMSTNLAVQVSPYKKLSFVGEAAFANGTYTEFFQGFSSTAFAKSAYLMVDDLPYNTFIMSGLYRPMFNTYDPDHNSLASVMTNLTYNSTFHATSIGTAPNVPFLNVHLLTPIDGASGALNNESAKSSGYVVNLGARFVTLGASATLSMWNTKAKTTATNEVTRQMTSLSLGGMYKKWVPTFDLVRIRKEDSSAIDEATVITFQNKYRLWREFYLEANYGTANSTVYLKQGSANELALGFRGFLLAGIEFQTLYISRSSKAVEAINTTNDKDDKLIQSQLHWYF